MSHYIHQLPEWPRFNWSQEIIAAPLAAVRHKQGRLLGRMEALGFSLRQEAGLETLTLDIVKTSEIEGETLNAQQVRSSIARRLGIDIAGAVPSDRNVEGVVEMMLDATVKFERPLSAERLFGWHAALFPTGHSGIQRITVGGWRDDAKGPMQVVSGPMGRESVHYEAPPARLLHAEMAKFIECVNHEISCGKRAFTQERLPNFENRRPGIRPLPHRKSVTSRSHSGAPHHAVHRAGPSRKTGFRINLWRRSLEAIHSRPRLRPVRR